MKRSSILVSADILKRKNPVLPQLKKEVHELLLDINAKIEDANKNGVVEIFYNLPIIFKKIECSYLSNADIQKYIYDNVMDEIIKKGFDARIRTTKTETLVKISWRIDLYSQAESNRIRQKLQELSF
jgi:hypothetical protein